MNEVFSTLAHWTAKRMGRVDFRLRLPCGHRLGGLRSDVSLLPYGATRINTGTTIVTFLMVFLLQHAQNRDSTAIQLKLDELIRVTRDARDPLLTLGDLSEAELDKFKGALAKPAAEDGLDVNLGEARETLKGAEQGVQQAKSAIVLPSWVGKS